MNKYRIDRQSNTLYVYDNLADAYIFASSIINTHKSNKELIKEHELSLLAKELREAEEYYNQHLY